MNFLELMKIELIKARRSRIVPLLFIAPLLVVSSGVASLSRYLTPEYTSAWPAMFIQSALVYAYYLLPLSMIVVCAMLESRETMNRGIVKMLTLPVSRRALSLAKFCVIALYLVMELAVFFFVFAFAGAIAVRTAGISEAMPVSYLLGWCAKLFLTMLPCAAVMHAITTLIERPLISAGINLALVIPGVLAANTPLWVIYPYCYGGYLVSCSLHEFTAGAGAEAFELFPFLPCAAAVFGAALAVAAAMFGRKEMR